MFRETCSGGVYPRLNDRVYPRLNGESHQNPQINLIFLLRAFPLSCFRDYAVNEK